MKDKQIVIFELTSNCNSYCEDCLRVGMYKKGYNMSYKDIKKSLKELFLFSKHFDNFELKISGGEPTIWRDNNKNILDIIKLCNDMNFNYSLVSNGKLFSFDNYCKKFFITLEKYGIKEITMYITIDKFHKNMFNPNNIILDNLLKYKNNIDLSLYVQSTVTTIKEENLPFSLIEKYSKLGVKFILNPLLPWGRGENLNEQVPYLNLKNSDKSGLGDYEKYLYILGKSKKIWDNYDEYLKFDNFESIKKLNCCGKTITLMGNEYFYCMPCSGKKEFKIANIGEFTYDKYIKFVENNNHINKMKKNEFTKNQIIEKCPIGYGICGLCREIVKNG